MWFPECETQSDGQKLPAANGNDLPVGRSRHTIGSGLRGRERVLAEYHDEAGDGTSVHEALQYDGGRPSSCAAWSSTVTHASRPHRRLSRLVQPTDDRPHRDRANRRSGAPTTLCSGSISPSRPGLSARPRSLRPTFEQRLAIIASVGRPDRRDSSVIVTEQQLIADIATGYDVVVMGADKWAQVNDPAWYRDDEAAAMPGGRRCSPTLALAPRAGFAVPDRARASRSIPPCSTSPSSAVPAGPNRVDDGTSPSPLRTPHRLGVTFDSTAGARTFSLGWIDVTSEQFERTGTLLAPDEPDEVSAVLVWASRNDASTHQRRSLCRTTSRCRPQEP